MKNNNEKLKKIYKTLFEAYGPKGWWPIATKSGKKGFDDRGYHKNSYLSNDDERFEISAGAILTQNTSWKNAEKAIINMKENNLLSRKAVNDVDERKLAELIKPAGYFNQKAKKLKIFARFDDKITRENLLGLWGIGKETADSILCYAYNEKIFVVDAYTQRIFHRIGFDENGYDEIQGLVMRNFNKVDELKEFHALLVELGKNTCKTTPLCDKCPLMKHCKKRDVENR